VSVSSFQPLNPRQLDLQRRLLVANELRETSLIAQLELQWVHRYGVTSLPKRMAEPSPDALPSVQSSELEPNIQPLSLVLLDAPYGSVTGQTCLLVLTGLTVGLFLLIRPLLNRKLS
jgi:hypothetical protein